MHKKQEYPLTVVYHQKFGSKRIHSQRHRIKAVSEHHARRMLMDQYLLSGYFVKQIIIEHAGV